MDLGRLVEQFQLFLCCIPGFAKPERPGFNPSRPRGIVHRAYIYVQHCMVKPLPPLLLQATTTTQYKAANADIMTVSGMDSMWEMSKEQALHLEVQARRADGNHVEY